MAAPPPSPQTPSGQRKSPIVPRHPLGFAPPRSVFCSVERAKKSWPPFRGAPVPPREKRETAVDRDILRAGQPPLPQAAAQRAAVAGSRTLRQWRVVLPCPRAAAPFSPAQELQHRPPLELSLAVVGPQLQEMHHLGRAAPLHQLEIAVATAALQQWPVAAYDAALLPSWMSFSFPPADHVPLWTPVAAAALVPVAAMALAMVCRAVGVDSLVLHC